jgi:hypothetical protein
MLSPSLVQQHRIALVSVDYNRVIVETNGKKPTESLWPDRSRQATLEIVKGQWPSNDALNTGVLCDDICAVDIDVDNNQGLVTKVIELARQLLGQGAPIRYRDNSTRVLTLYRVSDFNTAQRHKSVKGTHGSVDFLTGNKHFVAYGEHESGTLYQWDVDLKMIPRASLPVVTYEDVKHFRTQLAELMGEVASHVVPVPSPFVQCAFPQGFEPIPTRAPATKHELDYAQAALRNEIAKLLVMRTGSQRNRALNVAAHSLGTCISAGWIEREQVECELFQAAIDCGYVAKDGPDEARKTITSGVEAGMSKPREPLADKPLGSLPGNLVDPRTTSTTSEALAANSKAVAGQPKGKITVVLTRLGDLSPIVTDWHWKGYIPAGMLTLLAGAGGTGKSTLAFSFAATVTTAGHWPDGTRCATPGNVLIWSSEDDLTRTIVPRLIAAGADLNRIASVDGTVDERGFNIPFDPSLHMDDLRQQVRQVPGGVSLLIIDPIVSAVSGDMHRANDVRRSLQPIVDFANEQGCAVVGITHFAKNTGGNNTTERVIGSQAFAALARMVLVTAKEEESEQRVFTRAKSNISLDGGGFHYTIQETGVRDRTGNIINATRVVWGSAVEGNARSILSGIEGEGNENKPINRVEEAMQFLQAEIAHGPIPARELIERAKRDFGINERSLQRAREKMGIVATKAGYQGAWVWSCQL